MTDVEALVEGIRAAIAASATPERAAQEKRYLKSELEHLGATVPTIVRAVRDASRAAGPLKRAELLAAVDRLWQEPVHEHRFAATELLERHATLLEPADLPLLERLLRESRTWALVDPLAVQVVGDLLEREPATVGPTLDRWVGDGDMWLRRSALLACLAGLRAGGGDWPRFAGYADALLDEREFFVRKAIGWVLRETGKRRPELVADWLRPRARRASGVTFREAVKHLPAPVRAELERLRTGR